jgi:hypothetical protein
MLKNKITSDTASESSKKVKPKLLSNSFGLWAKDELST